MKKLIAIIAAVVAISVALVPAVAEVPADALGAIFLGLSFETTPEEIEKAAADYGLEYTKQNYNGSPKKTCYNLAYTEGAALQRYADSGDSMEIVFSRADGSFMYAVYSNEAAFVSAILFNYGSYFDLRAKEPGGPESGYYSQVPGKEYTKCASAEEALRAIEEAVS